MPMCSLLGQVLSNRKIKGQCKEGLCGPKHAATQLGMGVPTGNWCQNASELSSALHKEGRPGARDAGRAPALSWYGSGGEESEPPLRTAQEERLRMGTTEPPGILLEMQGVGYF